MCLFYNKLCCPGGVCFMAESRMLRNEHFFRGITKTVLSLFRGFFSEQNSGDNPYKYSYLASVNFVNKVLHSVSNSDLGFKIYRCLTTALGDFKHFYALHKDWDCWFYDIVINIVMQSARNENLGFKNSHVFCQQYCEMLNIFMCSIKIEIVAFTILIACRIIFTSVLDLWITRIFNSAGDNFLNELLRKTFVFGRTCKSLSLILTSAWG